MNNEKFDRLVAESTRSSLMESQRIDEWGKIGGKLWNVGKNLWKGAKQSMGFGQKAAQLDVNALKRGEQLYNKMQKGAKLTPQEAREAQTISKYIAMQRNAGNLNTISGAGERLRRLQGNANRWRMAGGMGAAALAGYGLSGGGGGTPGANMAGAGMDGTYSGTDMSDAGMYGTYPGTDMSGGAIGGMYPNGMYPNGMYPNGMYPNGGYGDGFYDPDPNSLYAYMGDYPYWYGDPYGYGYDYPYGYGYGGAYNDGGMDPMMMYYMMNGGWGY